MNKLHIIHQYASISVKNNYDKLLLCGESLFASNWHGGHLCHKISLKTLLLIINSHEAEMIITW